MRSGSKPSTGGGSTTARLQQLEAQGLVKRTPDRLRATDTGRLVLDRLIVELAA